VKDKHSVRRSERKARSCLKAHHLASMISQKKKEEKEAARTPWGRGEGKVETVELGAVPSL